MDALSDIEVSNGRLEWGWLSFWCGVSSKGRGGEEEAWQRVANGSTVGIGVLYAVCCERTACLSTRTDREVGGRRLVLWSGMERPSCWSFCFGSQRLVLPVWPAFEPASSQHGGSTLALADGFDGLARVERTGIRARACAVGPRSARFGVD